MKRQIKGHGMQEILWLATALVLIAGRGLVVAPGRAGGGSILAGTRSALE